MKKRDVLLFFGGVPATAKAMRITHQAVYKWPDEIPESTRKRLRRKVAKFLKKLDGE